MISLTNSLTATMVLSGTKLGNSKSKDIAKITETETILQRGKRFIALFFAVRFDMRKIVIPVLSLLLLLPFVAEGANDLTLSSANISVGGVTLVANGVVDEMVVDTSNVTFTLSSGSSLSVQSNDRKVLSTNLGLNVLCTDSYSAISVSGNSAGSTLVVTPSQSVCIGASGGGAAPSGGGGGGGAAPTTTEKPTTTTGQVTATASGGGKTTLTTSEGTIARADLPANAVSASTNVAIAAESKEAVVASRQTPSSRNIVGGYVYNYTATANGQVVSSFSKTVTLTFTYADAQISGLQESTLRVFYWKESTSQWVALPTTVDAANNSLTAETDHFTYFAIMGLTEGAEDTTPIVEETPSIEEAAIVDGDLVRNPNAESMAQFDIYIVKLVGVKKFKRLILSPHVFESYAHFDKNGNGSPWDDVKDISQSVMGEHTTSDLVRAVGDAKVYKLAASGDAGNKQWLNMTAAQFASGGYDADSIYEINATDRDAYTTRTDIMAGSSSETVIIKTANLKVRISPSLDGAVLATVHQGEVYNLIDEQEGWYRITVNDAVGDDVTGWCYSGDTGGYAAKQ